MDLARRDLQECLVSEKYRVDPGFGYISTLQEGPVHVEIPAQKVRIPSKDGVLVVELRHKLATPRKRPKRLQKKLEMRAGRKHIRSTKRGYAKVIPGTRDDLTSQQCREMIVLGEFKANTP